MDWATIIAPFVSLIAFWVFGSSGPVASVRVMGRPMSFSQSLASFCMRFQVLIILFFALILGASIGFQLQLHTR